MSALRLRAVRPLVQVLHARHYRPDIQRFITADKYASAAGDQLLQADPLTQNRYAFAGANPVSNIEFDGHIFDEASKMAIAHFDRRAQAGGRRAYQRARSRGTTIPLDTTTFGRLTKRPQTSAPIPPAQLALSRPQARAATPEPRSTARTVLGHLNLFDIKIENWDCLKKTSCQFASAFGNNPTRAALEGVAILGGPGLKAAATAGSSIARAVAGKVRSSGARGPATRAVVRSADLDVRVLSRPDLIGKAGNGPDVRELQGDAVDTYARLAHGARDAPHPTYRGGPRAELDDGTVIGLRQSNKWGPTLDVNPADGPAYRIHFK